jgi:hypothetical protein
VVKAMATIHSLEEYKENKYQNVDQSAFIDKYITPAYKDVIANISTFPPQFILKVMTECRKLLAK